MQAALKPLLQIFYTSHCSLCIGRQLEYLLADQSVCNMGSDESSRSCDQHILWHILGSHCAFSATVKHSAFFVTMRATQESSLTLLQTPGQICYTEQLKCSLLYELKGRVQGNDCRRIKDAESPCACFLADSRKQRGGLLESFKFKLGNSAAEAAAALAVDRFKLMAVVAGTAPMPFDMTSRCSTNG
jgi:hypothetical protein